MTQKVNSLRCNSPCAKNARKTHCKNGHPFDEKNTRVNLNGGRACRLCDNINHSLKKNLPPNEAIYAISESA